MLANANLLVEDQKDFELQIATKKDQENSKDKQEENKVKFGRFTLPKEKNRRSGSAVTLDRTEAAMSDEDNEDVDEDQGSSDKRSNSDNMGDFMVKYKSIQTWHVRSVLVYWICTICMLIECFILFVIVVTPAVLRFPEEYEYLKGQEILLFVLACL